MAQKRAIVFVIDVGSTMGDCHNGRTVSDLDWSMQWAWDKMANIMSRGLKGDNVGVIGLRTDDSNNPMAESDSSYEHISVLKELGVLEMPDLRSLQEAIKPSETDDGDAISAIAIATERIAEFTTLKTGKLGKFERAIYLLTDGQGGMDGEGLDPIAERINELEIKLTVM
jgi:ATP-dependent DNA helicase 2 subunit 2